MTLILATLLVISLAHLSWSHGGVLRMAAPSIVLQQAFRYMVGPGHCPMISKYGPSLSKAVGPVDPSFIVAKKSHFNKNVHLTASL